jgi:dTDP-4-dehydrorhamnose reductase
MQMKPKLLLTGKTGQLGSELFRLLPAFGEVIAPGRNELDLRDANSIRRVVQEIRPEVIINAAAYTAVDAAENQKAEVYAINAVAPAVFAEEARKIGAAILHYSTDYVFDGSQQTPYEETDIPNPINEYGKTKLAGEQAILASGVPYLIFRTAWLYASRGRNFLLTILRLATEREEIRIVHDQFGAPTWSREIAESTAKILGQLPRDNGAASALSKISGIYHLSAEGVTTWHEFACAILEEARHVANHVPWFGEATNGQPLVARRVIPISTAEYPTQALRPAYSVLSNAHMRRTFGFALSDWRLQLHAFFGAERVAPPSPRPSEH